MQPDARLAVTYDDFLQELGRAGLTVRDFAELLAMRPNSVSNNARRGEVPSHIAVISSLLAEMQLHRVPYRPVFDRLDLSKKKPRGGALPGKFGGDKQPPVGIRPMIQAAPISLDTTHTRLGWPDSHDIIDPPGSGASVFARLVQAKIGTSLRRFPEARNTRVGVLMGDPYSSTSEPPLAIVAESRTELEIATLRELHRLAWNFSHVPIVITIEPSLLRVWSCCEAPNSDRDIHDYLVESVRAEHLAEPGPEQLEDSAARALHWINWCRGSSLPTVHLALIATVVRTKCY